MLKRDYVGDEKADIKEAIAIASGKMQDENADNEIKKVMEKDNILGFINDTKAG